LRAEQGIIFTNHRTIINKVIIKIAVILTDGAKKGMPKKSSPMRVVTKDFNSQVVETEMIPDMPAK
jgi:hypothetical protein